MPRAAPTKRSAVPAPSQKKDKSVRAPSAYNVFMKTELPRVKAEDPNLSHKDAFKIVAANWKDSPLNPVNKK